MTSSTKKHYYELGKLAFFGLHKVRGLPPNSTNIDVFTSTDGFQTYVKTHRMDADEVEEFKKGFVFASKKTVADS